MKKLLLLFLLAAVTLSADIIKLRDGKTYEGLARINDKNVTIVVGENIFQFPMKDIAESTARRSSRRPIRPSASPLPKAT